MIASTDAYLDRRYDRANYNCLHFARDVWYDLTGVDVTERLIGVLGSPDKRHTKPSHLRGWTKHKEPVDPCVVIFSRTRSQPHMGIYFRGSVLHLHERGVSFQPVDIAARGFDTVRYYT
jgi:hypothetical protein